MMIKINHKMSKRDLELLVGEDEFAKMAHRFKDEDPEVCLSMIPGQPSIHMSVVRPKSSHPDAVDKDTRSLGREYCVWFWKEANRAEVYNGLNEKRPMEPHEKEVFLKVVCDIVGRLPRAESFLLNFAKAVLG